MLNFQGMRFPIDVILVCIRWYVAYPLLGTLTFSDTLVW